MMRVLQVSVEILIENNFVSFSRAHDVWLHLTVLKVVVYDKVRALMNVSLYCKNLSQKVCL